MMTDLLSPPVAPGAEVRTGVTLPAGTTFVDHPVLTDVAIGRFIVVGTTLTPGEDGVWYELHALNVSASDTVRLSATIEFADVAPEAAPEAPAAEPTPVPAATEEPEITITPAAEPAPEATPATQE